MSSESNARPGVASGQRRTSDVLARSTESSVIVPSPTHATSSTMIVKQHPNIALHLRTSTACPLCEATSHNALHILASTRRSLSQPAMSWPSLEAVSCSPFVAGRSETGPVLFSVQSPVQSFSALQFARQSRFRQRRVTLDGGLPDHSCSFNAQIVSPLPGCSARSAQELPGGRLPRPAVQHAGTAALRPSVLWHSPSSDRTPSTSQQPKSDSRPRSFPSSCPPMSSRRHP